MTPDGIFAQLWGCSDPVWSSWETTHGHSRQQFSISHRGNNASLSEHPKGKRIERKNDVFILQACIHPSHGTCWGFIAYSKGKKQTPSRVLPNRNVTFVLWSYAGLKPKLFGAGRKKEYGAVRSVVPPEARDRKGT